MNTALNDIMALLTGYQQLRVHSRRLFPSTLAASLKIFGSDPNDETAALVYQVYFTEIGFLNRLFFSCLAEFSELARTKALTSINTKTKVFTGSNGLANLETVAKSRSPISAAFALRSLEQAGLLVGTQAKANREIIGHKKHPQRLTESLCILQRAGLLTGEQAQRNWKAITETKHSDTFEYALAILEESGLLAGAQAQANLDRLIQAADDISSIKLVLMALRKYQLLISEWAQTNFEIVSVVQTAKKLAAALLISRSGDNKTVLEMLSDYGLLMGDQAQANFMAVAQASAPASAALNLFYLNQAELLTGEQAQANRTMVAQVHDFNDRIIMERVLKILTEAELLRGAQGQANFEAAVQAANLLPLYMLHQAQLLTVAQGQNNFTAVMVNHAPLLTHDHLNQHWQNIPAYLLTQAHLNTIIALAAEHQHNLEAGLAALERYFTRLLAEENDNDMEQQSTHTASVHAATDLTLWLLYSKYGKAPTQNMVLAWSDITNAVAALTPSADLSLEVIAAASRCLVRLRTNQDQYGIELTLNAEKKALGLSLLTKLELTNDAAIIPLWETLQADKDQFITLPLTDFMSWLFIEVRDKPDYIVPFTLALYEIQRGYNINKQGIDDGDNKDKHICYGGTANKFCETLSSLSTLILFIYANKKSINKKLRESTVQALLTHIRTLRAQAMQGGNEERENFETVITQLNNDETVGDILSRIFDQAEIAKAVEDEFSGLCAANVLPTCLHDFQVALPYLNFKEHEDYKALSRSLQAEVKPSASYSEGFFQPQPGSKPSHLAKETQLQI